MPSVNIIRSDHPEGPADKGIVRAKMQEKRKDPEATVLREFIKSVEECPQGSNTEEIVDVFCEKLDVTFEELIHKLEIFYGNVEDDEREWRKQKYGKQ